MLKSVGIGFKVTGQCGFGELLFSNKHFLYRNNSENAECPDVLLSSRESSSKTQQSPEYLAWRPPSCGCVEVRAVVFIRKRLYTTDKEDTKVGHLVTTACVQLQRKPELHMNALCYSLAEGRMSDEIVARHTFLERHGLQHRYFDTDVVQALESRIMETSKCCTKENVTFRVDCFDSIRFRRVDELCKGGIPDIRFTAFRARHMQEKQKLCCSKTGQLKGRFRLKIY
ncbi:hypothetical protein PoB_001662800 [Plakobranchus ocellatus]|uniref:Uncharacterized protein n=1 Tax=Plakobranchus ocellatus TaxID=259542 RepID=A0AAV3Z5Y6_9GAST|nr:hypothetical protein PoB_001662800 [Plakobranchus ocellatus]